jgi:hypothetical protein
MDVSHVTINEPRGLAGGVGDDCEQRHSRNINDERYFSR